MLGRIKDSYTVSFARFALGLRPAYSSLTEPERQLLARLARGKRCVVEVGVFEGVTSRLFCEVMPDDGELWLVDPFFRETRAERLLGLSFAEHIARRGVRAYPRLPRFLRKPSLEAAASIGLDGRCELIFIDARHDYDSVRDDFRAWSPKLAPGARLAFHDSRLCAVRPDLTAETGSVRFARELTSGLHGAFVLDDSADSITVVRAA